MTDEFLVVGLVFVDFTEKDLLATTALWVGGVLERGGVLAVSNGIEEKGGVD